MSTGLTSRRLTHSLVLALGVTMGTVYAQPAPAGVAVRSGGASDEQFQVLTQAAAGYSLRLLFAAKGSGAYLADVDVTLRSMPGGATVVEHRSQGPLMLAALPPGRYEMTARYTDVVPGSPASVTRTIVVPATGQASVVVQFDTPETAGRGAAASGEPKR